MNRLTGVEITQWQTGDVPEENLCERIVNRYEWILLGSSDGSAALNGESWKLNKPMVFMLSPGDRFALKGISHCARADWDHCPDEDLMETKVIMLNSSQFADCQSYLQSAWNAVRKGEKASERQITAYMLLFSDVLYTAREESGDELMEHLAGRMMDWIDHHFSGEINMENMARDLGRSRSYLHRAFSATLGITPQHYWRKNQIARTRVLLESTNLGLRQIDSLVGISSAAYLVKIFSDETGLTPGEYRQRSRS